MHVYHYISTCFYFDSPPTNARWAYHRKIAKKWMGDSQASCNRFYPPYLTYIQPLSAGRVGGALQLCCPFLLNLRVPMSPKKDLSNWITLYRRRIVQVQI